MSDDIRGSDLLERARSAAENVRNADRRARVEAGRLREPREAALAAKPWARARRDALRSTMSDSVDHALAVLHELEAEREGSQGDAVVAQIGVLETSLASLAEASDLLEGAEAGLRRAHESSPGRAPAVEEHEARSGEEMPAPDDAAAQEPKVHPRALVVARNALIACLIALVGVAAWLFVIPHESRGFKDCVGTGRDEAQCRCLDEAAKAGLDEEDQERFCAVP